jgi:hypothetical protein
MAARLQSVQFCATKLTAQVVVDGGTAVPLTVDCLAGTVSGTVPGLTPGNHRFNLQFLYEGVLVATAITTGTIASNQNTPIAFPPGSLAFLDTDDDGWTDLAELIAGTEPQLATSFPDSSVRRQSADFAIADVAGTIPVIGTAKTDRYVNSLGQGPFKQ